MAAGLFLAGVAVLGLASVALAQEDAPAASAAPADAKQDVSIPAGDLQSALERLSSTTGLRILFGEDELAGLRTNGVSGSHTPQAALEILLAGTDLVFQPVETGTVTVTRATIQDDERVNLSALTVLGTRRSDVPLSNVPSSITVVPREQIEEEQVTANRIEDILARKVPGLNPTNNGVRQIRGRTAQVFVNGVPVNEQLRASSGSDLNLLSPDQLEDIEVSRGANSAYGFGSPGGIIALRTPRAESADLTLRTTLRDSFNPQHFNGSHQATLYQSASQIVGNFDYQIGGVVGYDGNDYDADGDLALGFDNAALITNGEEILTNFDGSFGYDLEEYGSLRLASTFGYVDFVRMYALNPGVYRQEYGFLTREPKGNDSYRQSYTANLTYEKQDLLFGSDVKLEGFTSDTHTEVYTTWDSVNYRDEQTNTYYGMRSSISTPLDFILKDAAVTYGFDFIRNDYFRPYFNDDTKTIETFFSPDVTFDSYAPYLQLDIPFYDFVLSGGVRHEEYRGSVDSAPGGIIGGDIQDFNLTLYNAGLLYFVTDEIEVYTTFSQGAEITQLGRAARDAVSADQVDPEPAKSNQYEAGVRGNWSSVQFGVAGFYTESDLLSALVCDGINPCTPLREPREFWGVEANGFWKITSQWGLGGIIGWMEGNRELESGETRRIGSRDTPPVLFTTYLDYSPFEWWRNRVQVNYRGSRDPFGDSIEYGEGRVEDLVLLNVSAAFDCGPGTLALGVRNLLNEKYTSIPAEADNSEWLWIPEQGARITASYSIKW